MHSRKLLLLATVASLSAPACASADFGHVIAPGESLSSVAATDGVSVDQLAAANGISPGAPLVAGSTLQIPPQSAGGSQASAAGDSSGSSAASAVTGGGSSPTAAESSAQSSASAAGSSGSGGYTVQPGDTLSTLADRYGTTVHQLAAANGLDPSGILPEGMSLSVGASAGPVSTPPGSDPGSSGSGGPQPTPETVSPSDVGQVASANGVSPSLADAIGDQESGFNNNLVSRTGATGVMQIEPGTWDYIASHLTSPPPLSPGSARDNIRAGVLLLHSLLDQTGGDPALAAAGYYQGLQSVRRHGLYSDTQRYVNNVMALRHRFGGP